MQFIYFQSRRVGINLDHVEWYSMNESADKLSIKMTSKQQFFIDDIDEISLFFNAVVLMDLKE